MTVQDDRLIRTRFSDLASGVDDSDWSDVRRRARGHRRARLLVVAGALLVVAASVPALGLSDQVVRLFERSEPAPEPIKGRVAQFGARLGPDVVAKETRVVLEVAAGDGFRAALYVAPRKSGGYCTLVEDWQVGGLRPGGGVGGCDRERVVQFSTSLFAHGPADDIKGPVVFHGRAHDERGDAVRFDFEDGDHTMVPLVWVSKPIDAGFFLYPVPKKRWVEGHRPVSATLQDAEGKPLRKQPLRWWFSTPPRKDR